MSAPYYLTPKATKLPAGHDASLDPAELPTDPATRSSPPTSWPVVSAALGGTDAPDAPLAPPATHPGRRSLAPFEWPVGIASPNRPLAETCSPVGDLDPDVAMWPVTLLQRWPFTGPPLVGIWPKGWLGVDNTATMYVCTVGGEPGTWAPIGTGTQGPPGAPGPAGPQGAQGPPGSQFVGSSILPTNFGGLGAGVSTAIVAVEVNGNGSQRYTVSVGGTFSKSTSDAAGDCNAYLVRSDNPSQALSSTIDTVPVNSRASFFTQISDIPPAQLSYWLIASTTGNFASMLAGARMLVWATA